MDKIRLYRVLDIDSADEFQYFENLAALLEEDEYAPAAQRMRLVLETENPQPTESRLFEDLPPLPDEEEDEE